MANGSSPVVTIVSWMFPISAAIVGIYAGTQATTDAFSLLIAALALVVASLVGVATSNSDNHFTIGLAVAAAIPFVFSSQGGDLSSGPQGVDLAGTLAAYGLGLALVWALRFSRGEEHADLLPILIRRFGGYVVYAVVYSGLRVGVLTDLTGRWEDLLPFAGAWMAWLALEIFLQAMLVLGPRELSRSYLARAMLHDLNVFLGLVLTGALFGELYKPLDGGLFRSPFSHIRLPTPPSNGSSRPK